MDYDAIKQQVLDNQKVIDELNQQLRRKADEIEIIQAISSEILNTLDLERIFETVLRTMDEVFGFHHALILLKAAEKDQLIVAASRGYEQPGIGARVNFGQGVIGVVAARRKIIRMGGVASQMMYAGAVRDALGMEEKTVALPGLPGALSQMAIPLLSRDHLVGVFAVESAEPAAFKAMDEKILSIVGNQIAAALENAAAYKAQKDLAEATGRFVPGELLEQLGLQSITQTGLGDHVEGIMTILFSDIRNFTTILEGLSPRESFQFVNEYLGTIAPVIREHNGFIDKYIGDAIMAIFPHQPLDAVQAALAMQEQLKVFNQERMDAPVRIGIGIHTGRVMLGIVGHANRLDGTAIGDSVNLAARIEGLTRQYNCDVMASESTIGMLPVPAPFACESVGQVQVKGKTRPVEVFCIQGAEAAAAAES
ncbi:MAG: GAF domain-containing protein [Spirochaetales bacterium]|nr:GAF domain-containing protein [Spirochaetales bacterium]